MHKNQKVALITGAARRIGAEITRTLHAAGMNVVLHFNASEGEAVALCEQLNQQRNHSAVAIQAALQEQGSEEALVKQAVGVWQRLDVLVNNASRFYRTTMGKVTEYAWDDLMNSNLKAPFFLAQAAIPFLTQHQGSIVNIVDIHAERPLHDYPVYCISKGGLVAMTRVLAKELAPHIRVNAVAPGAIIWPEGENQLSNVEKDAIISHTPLQRSGSPDDIAKAVLFFVQEATFVTGQILSVDGGRSFA